MLSNLPGNPVYCAIGCQFSLEVVTYSVTMVRSQPERISPSNATFLKWNLSAYTEDSNAPRLQSQCYKV